MSLLLRTAAIRAIEQREFAAAVDLMDRAGRAGADTARRMLRTSTQYPARVLILAGPGNNGGDALEIAVHLKMAGCSVEVCLAARPDQLPPDAARAHAKWRAVGGQCSASLPSQEQIALVDLVVDGLFGIGLTRTIGAPYAQWIATVNASQAAVLALDVPSGLDADSGVIHGSCLRAQRTITFIADKPGLHTLHGPDHAGMVEVATLGLRVSSANLPALAQPNCPTHGHLIGQRHFAALLKPRPRDSHKGSFGTLAIIGGAAGMSGAALLAGRAALRLGAGKVWVGLLDEHAPTVDLQQPELMLRNAADIDVAQCSALVIGPGLGTGAAAHRALAASIGCDAPLLLDADALNLIGSDAGLARAVAQRRGATLLTPHPQEAARLLGTDTAAIQADRIGSACALAQRYQASVVLKGAGSVIAAQSTEPLAHTGSAAPPHADAAWWINPSGNPGMASAGMGDVLSGLAGGLLAQFPSRRDAETVGASHSWHSDALQCLVGAVFLHGAAADLLVERGCGPIGLTAGEVIDAARELWNQWTTGGTAGAPH